jgi:hypothetical protein
MDYDVRTARMKMEIAVQGSTYTFRMESERHLIGLFDVDSTPMLAVSSPKLGSSGTLAKIPYQLVPIVVF